MEPEQPALEGLLVCVMADGQAGQLVEHALQVYASDGKSVRVLNLDTVSSRLASADMKADLERALARAQAGGAEIVRQSLAVDTAHHLISTIVHQAHAVRARHLLLGNQALGRRYWAGLGERISDFAEVLAASLPRMEIDILVAPSRAPRYRVPGPPWIERLKVLAAPSTWGLPVAVVVACTLLSALLAQRLHPINLLLLFLVGVLYVALRRGLAPAVMTVVLSILVYDWIFVEPRWSFKPTDPEYFFTFAIMLGVGLAAGSLAARARDVSLHALAQANRAQALSLLAQNIAKARSPDDIAEVVSVAVERALSARGELTAHPVSEPGTALVFELVTGGESQGRLLVRDLPPAHQGAEDLHLLQAFADQAAVAIERYRHERSSAERTIEAETERVRNTLLAGISHDFRTPLTTIIGAVSTVLTQGAHITVDQRNDLARSVLEQAERLQALTSDLLDLARLQDGAVRPQCEWCPAGELLRESTAMVASALAGHELLTEVADTDVVWCDARLAGQAATNLLLNAAQHSPPGSRVRLGVRVDDGEGRWILTVRDEGPGLTPGREQEVFRKFHRDTDAEGSRGTGLGLAICEVVARLHGGGIAARNEGGAVFEMWFPQPAHPALPGE